MFTGIIKCIGKIIIDNSNIKITIIDKTFIIGLQIGDSISVNGVCMTVISFDCDTINFFIMEETKKLTKFNTEYVNLERALKLGSDISGHFITGHINNTGIIVEITDNDDTSKIFKIQINIIQNFKYKDSIAINGVSLTIANIDKNFISVCLIPHTIYNTIFKYATVGDFVNIEYGITESYDIDYMNKAIQLSKLGRLTTIPNPWVGCVIVNHNVIIGEGYHQKCGEHHAEKMAIMDAIDKGNESLIKGSDVYVTLEPCNHYGRTPPCSKLLVDYKVKKVIIGQRDTDTITGSQGIAYLQKNNIEIEFSHETKIKKLLKSYNHSRLNKKPYCILKTAVSLDGCIATGVGDSKWISNEKSRDHVQKLRAKCHGIIVGSKTVLKDNPRLNVRNFNIKQQPLRIILDTYNSLTDEKLNIFDTTTSKTLIFTGVIPKIKITGVLYEIVNIVNDKLNLEEVMIKLNELGIMQCLVEGGSELYTSFIELGLANELYMYRSNINIGCTGVKWCNYKGNDILNNNNRWPLIKIKQFDNDILSIYNIPTIKTLPLKKSIESAIEALQNNKPIIIMDDNNRENEGDLIIPAEKITPDIVSFMMRHTTGIICVTMNENRSKQLALNPMTTNNQDPNRTNFMISCDYIGSTTGISAEERCTTIKMLANDQTKSEDLSRPGHVFPLVGHPNGLASRQGHTESSINICELAGLKPIAAIAELVNPNGTVMRYSDCKRFALMYDIPLITIEDLLKFQSIIKTSEKIKNILKPDVQTVIMTKEYGEWTLLVYSINNDIFSQTHRVLIKNIQSLNDIDMICIRIHSDCYTGEVLNSAHCDCGDQLNMALKIIHEKKQGLIIFPANHEGRGIGLINKLKAYNKINEIKCDTYTANNLIGYDDDIRNYDIVPKILDSLNIKKIELLTNNINKINILSNYIKEITPLITSYNKYNINYIIDKNEKYGYINDQYLYTELTSHMNTKYSIALITTQWHSDKLELTKQNIIKNLETNHNIMLYTVPGSFEIPLMAKNIINKTKCDAVICLGLILKGDTAHFEYISQSAINGLMNTQLEMNTPIINGILNCYTLDQAIQRLDPNYNFSTSLIESLNTILNINKTLNQY